MNEGDEGMSEEKGEDRITVYQNNELHLMQECVCSFQQVTGLGCLLCSPAGAALYEKGYSVKRCTLCAQLGAADDLCVVSRSRAWHESERFGGKYIYNCPMGLTCIATPVQTDSDTVGYVTVGPFLMIEREDFLHCELESYAKNSAMAQDVEETMKQIASVSPEQAEATARQLFLSVGGIGKAFRIGDMFERQNTMQLMGELNDFTSAAKQNTRQISYPLQMEKEFLQAICYSEKEKAEALLNQLLGHIFFLTGGDFSYIRARICELLVLSARAAIDGGADETRILSLCQTYVEEMQDIYNVDKLCFWLTGVLRQLIGCLFGENCVHSGNVMPRALSYIHLHFNRRITLEEVAHEAHLSASYFSRLFKSETGLPFSEYVQRTRIEQAKRDLRQKDCPMADIAEKTGFFDQSHFIKTFKQATGVTPGEYRRRRGRGYDELKTKERASERAPQ